MKKIFKTLPLVFGTLLMMTSCNKDNDAANSITAQEQITSAEVSQNLEAIKASNFVDKLVLNRSKDINDNLRLDNQSFNDCIDFEYDFPKSYSVTYNDCDINGNKISGKILVEYTREQGTVTSSVTFEDFAYNDRSINGNKTTKFVYNRAERTWSHNITTDLAMVNGTDTATVKGTKTVDVVYENGAVTTTTTGSWNTTINDDSYSIVADAPLVAVSSCRYIVSGVLTITENDETSSLDYGNGECDNLATLTLPDGTTEEIEL